MKESSISKIIGGTEEERKEAEKLFGNAFREQRMFKSIEHEKTPDELKLLLAVDNLTSEIAKNYGAKEPASVLPDNVHIVDKEILKKLFLDEFKMEAKKNLSGFFSMRSQAVFVIEGQNINELLYLVAHEMYHFKGYGSFQVKKSPEGEARYAQRRGGWGIVMPKRKQNAFQDMDEAVTDMLTAKTISGIVDQVDNIGISKEIADEIKNKYQEDPEAAYYLGYVFEKERLWDLLTEIYRKNKDRFENIDDVFDLFAKTIFTGKLINVARLIEKTFGKGSFRKIGEDGLPKTETEKEIDKELEDMEKEVN